MVDDAGRNGVAVDVGHQVGAHHHRHVLLVEGINHGLQGVLVFIHVVAIELNNKFSCLLVVCRQVPVAANSHVVVVGYDVDEAGVIVGCNGLASAVGREVVNYHEVKLEIGLLAENAINGVADGADAVTNGNHDSSLNLKVVLAKLNVLEVGHFLAVNYLGGSQVTTYLLEMLGASCLHLDLTTTVAWVHIVEDFLATLACVKLHVAIQVLIDVSDGTTL